MKRDIADYTDQYTSLPFESVQAACRRNMLLKQIAAIAPETILDIGCGEKPLFTDLPDTITVSIVEPSNIFTKNARKLASNRANITIHHGFMEDLVNDGTSYELIILSSLLHEVPNPQALLKSVRDRCTEQTIVHINTPNARSMHRLLGVAMGAIPHPNAISSTQKKLQQNRPPYDQLSLEKEIKSAGFEIVETGDILIKPFTHAQMQQLIDNGFLNEDIIKGLERLVEDMPGFGSEIWMNAKISK